MSLCMSFGVKQPNKASPLYDNGPNSIYDGDHKL